MGGTQDQGQSGNETLHGASGQKSWRRPGAHVDGEKCLLGNGDGSVKAYAPKTGRISRSAGNRAAAAPGRGDARRGGMPPAAGGLRPPDPPDGLKGTALPRPWTEAGIHISSVQCKLDRNHRCCGFPKRETPLETRVD
ncbi:hypothetical protein DVDV_2858 [Desulfovibrio sp. DV]|nr:hypothetical protein DVDV_2858 [Desulfovibrio sp. DV]